jgi:hypothetical protein
VLSQYSNKYWNIVYQQALYLWISIGYKTVSITFLSNLQIQGGVFQLCLCQALLFKVVLVPSSIVQSSACAKLYYSKWYLCQALLFKVVLVPSSIVQSGTCAKLYYSKWYLCQALLFKVVLVPSSIVQSGTCDKLYCSKWYLCQALLFKVVLVV